VWDGGLVEIIEAQFYDASLGTYDTYGSTNIDISDGTSSDILYIGSLDPLVGIYVDVQGSPNETASTSVSAVSYWQNGNAWASVTSLNDGTAGFSHTGYLTFKRQSDVFKQQFGGLQYDMYWYKIVWDKTLSINVKLSISVIPYFDITENGQKGLVSCAWRNRGVYVFDRWPVDIYVSATYGPMVLNGEDSAILERPGDGRMNKVVCIKKFFNNLLVFQEEKGTEGGCVTMYQGYSPDTFGKLLLSTRFGTFNAKSAVVVEGILMGWSTTGDKPVTVCFFLSHYGVFMTDGTTFIRISEQKSSSIQNYFDPKQSECIRRGYEDKMWIAYDSAYNCLKLGIVSGGSSFIPNVFPVYDIEDRAWSFDKHAQEFTCYAEVEAASGDVAVLQVAGGADDGYVYQTNTTNNDVSTAIDAYATMEIDGEGADILMRDLILRLLAGGGDCTLTASLDGVAQDPITIGA